MITMADRKAAAAGEEEQFLERVENPDPNDVSWCISTLVCLLVVYLLTSVVFPPSALMLVVSCLLPL